MRYLVVFLLLIIPTISHAGTHYVSPTGSDTWENSTNIATPCSLDTANSNAAPGDVVYLREGTYNTHIFPAISGTNEARITYEAYAGETPVIINTTTTYATYYHGIGLIGRSYITIKGITVGPDTSHTMNRILMISHAASYNEIDGCNIFGDYNGEILRIWKGNSALGDEYAATHNVIKNSVIANNIKFYESGGAVYECMGMQIGDASYDHVSNYNTIENCTLYMNGHHNLETFTKYNVIRENFIHQAPGLTEDTAGTPAYPPDSNGKYGHRNIQIYDGGANDGMFNLIEGNRFGPSTQPVENDGGNGLTITAPKNIVRYNEVYNSQNNGIKLKTGASSLADNNTIYNNTVFNSGRYKQESGQWQGLNFRWYGTYERVGNKVKNNIIYGYGAEGADWGGGSATIYTDNTVENNFCTDASEGICSASGNPVFVDHTLPSIDSTQTRMQPNLAIQPSSPARNGGTHLTTVHADDTGSGTSLVVTDALYFQDGSWGSSLSDIQADWIAVGTVSNAVQISSIDYATNTITLANGITRSDGDPVWLYKKSNGTVVLYGTAPDYGAHEYMGNHVVGSGPTATVGAGSTVTIQ